MSKKCARCEKTVYPIEELKCLDKIWHKLCFKCQVCNMTLNMKTYKGYNKQPYCEAHIPKAKATTVAETPELKRIQENTKIQSNVMYHAEFEKAKGKFTQVADDPETLRIKQNSKIISNVAYHGELEKKAIMEQKRVMTGENGEPIAGEISSGAADHSPKSLLRLNRRGLPTPAYEEEEVLAGMGNDGGGGGGMAPPHPSSANHQPNHQNHNHHHTQQQQAPPPTQPQPQQQQQQHHIQPTQYEHQRAGNNNAHYRGQPPHQQQVPVQFSHHAHHQPGKIADYDPMAETRSSPYTARQSATVIYTSDHGPVTNPPSRRIGSIADLDPVNDFYGSLTSEYRPPAGDGRIGMGNSYGNQMPQHHQPHSSQAPISQQQQQAHHHHQGSSQPAGRIYRALYDYEAQDSDEVSFADGDLIIDCTPIDDGWMTGLVRRTGQSGMLPANYVELAN